MPFNKDGTDFRFLTLLLTLFAVVLLPPYFESLKLVNLSWKILFSGVLFSAIYAIIGQRKILFIGVVLMVPTLATNWLDQFFNVRILFYLDNLTTIAFLGFICLHIFKYILNCRQVTTNVIYASMCLYLMLALIWAAIFTNIQVFYGSAFAFSDPGIAAAAERGENLMPIFSYFSFVTISTLGYGEIVPIHRVAHAWAAVLAMIGQFYIAIVMARLVSLYGYRGDGALKSE